MELPAAPFVLSVGMRDDQELGWVEGLPFVTALLAKPLRLHAGVTFLVGENGSGKSTLIEALGIACGFAQEGGSAQAHVYTRSRDSPLANAVVLERSRLRPLNGFFLRAESFFDFATAVESMPLENVYTRPLHEQSHGESFLALALERFGPRGLYILDEPEAALSVTGQLALMRRMHELVEQHAQFVVATHSPILLGYPDALIYELGADGIEPREYEETEQYLLTRDFLANRERFLHHLLADD